MTPRQLKRLVRSVAFRRRMMKGLPDLEAELRAFLMEQEVDAMAVDGFKVRLEGNELKLERITADQDLDQLRFDWEEFWERYERDRTN